ncbi:acyl-CoA carboxylase epsilon subunit, partial [Spirillospora sp. NPDC047418]
MSAGVEIVRGRLDERELAALVAVLLHAGDGGAAAGAAPPGAGGGAPR